ncbi:hypothetical protein [Streptosporangium sp. NPDC002607]
MIGRDFIVSEVLGPLASSMRVFHNRRRRHSALRMRTPIEYEMLYPNTRLA